MKGPHTNNSALYICNFWCQSSFVIDRAHLTARCEKRSVFAAFSDQTPTSLFGKQNLGPSHIVNKMTELHVSDSGEVDHGRHWTEDREGGGWLLVVVQGQQEEGGGEIIFWKRFFFQV